MNKLNKNLVIGIFVALVIVISVFFFVSKKEIVENSNGSVMRDDQVDFQVYENNKYGFKFNYIGDSDRFRVAEGVVDSNHSYFDSEAYSYIEIGYELDNPILKVENDPLMGYMKDMTIWYLNIVPVEIWQENACDQNEHLCRQGEVLAKNGKYVFEAGFKNVQGAGSICHEDLSQQQQFCSFYNNFTIEGGEFQFELIK